MTKVKEPISPKELSDLKSELKEEKEWRMRLHGEVDELTKQRADSKSLNAAIVNGLVTERIDLVSRILRIDARIMALGFSPTKVFGEIFGCNQ